MEKREKEVVLALFAVALLVGVGIYSYSNSTQPYIRKAPQPLNRAIVFPRDEGCHDEPEEVWALFMNVSEGNEYFYIWVSWSTSQIRDAKNSTVILSILEKNETPEYMTSMYISENFFYSNSSLSLNLSKNGNHFNFKSAGTGTYKLSIISFIDGKNIKLNLTMNLMKNPVLFTQKNGNLPLGELYFGNGTFFGYFLPRLSIKGNMDFENKSSDIEGSAGMMHYWGGASVDIFEFIFAQIKGIDVFSLTYYNPGGDKIALEQVYVIYNNRYSVYSTFEGKTIGELICNNTIEKSLHNEKYTYYPLSYLQDPTDPSHSRVYARNWTLITTYDKINLTIDPIIKDQFAMPVLWLGASDVRSNEGDYGWSFSALSKRYISSPYINNLDVKKRIIDNNNYLSFNITASDSIPLSKIILKYNYSGENFTTDAVHIRGNLWSATVGSFDRNSTIEYEIDAIDSAGNAATEKGSYNI